MHPSSIILLAIRLDERAKCIEEPAMTVKLLLVLLLETENDLDWACTRGDFACLGHHHARCVSKDSFSLEDQCTEIRLTRIYAQ